MPTVMMQIGACKEKYTIDGRTGRIMHAKRGTVEKECKRPGCDNIIPSSFSYDAEYCSGQCGSLDAKRKRRNPEAEEVNKMTIIRALLACQGNKSHAAEMLDMPKSTLHYKIKRYNIRVKE